MNRLLLPLLLSASSLLAQSQRYFVDQNAAGMNNGQSWHDAFLNLHDALALAHAGDEIWVARGTYRPSDNGDRSARFQMLSGVQLLGGFAGNEFFADERIPGANPSILSGDIGIPGDSTDNSFNLMYILHPDASTLIDGFTFRDALANNDQINFGEVGASGAALYLNGQDGIAYPTILDCTFEHNTATGPGGAVYASGGGSGSVAPVFQSCNFIKNRSAQSSGGAVFRQGGSWIERPGDFDNCLFDGNYAWFNGGSIYFSDSERSDTLQVQNCRFFRNYARIQSAGICIGNLRKTKTTYLRVSGCRFEEQNHSEGVVHLDQFNSSGNLHLDVKNCNIKKINWATNDTYGVFFIEATGAVLQVNLTNLVVESCFDNRLIDILPTQPDIMTELNIDNLKIQKCNAILVALLQHFKADVKNIILLDNKSTALFIVTSNGILSLKNIVMNNNTNLYIITIQDFITTKISNLVCINNTIGIGNQIETEPYVYNSVFINNKNPDGTKALSLFNYDPSSLYIHDPVNYYHCMTDLDTLYADFDSGTLFGVNPLFADTAAGDFHLLPCSPGVDAGLDDIIDSLHLSTDITGAPRIRGNHVDMGAYESYDFSSQAPHIRAACDGLPVGAIALNPVNGCPPFNCAWSPALGTGTEISDLPAGQYRVTVTDSHGWQYSDTINVPLAASPQITGTQVLNNVDCGSPDGGSAAVSVSNGTAPYSFLWSNGMSGSPGLMLPAGQSSVTVTDLNGCTDSVSLTILKQGQLTLMVDGSPIACHDEHNGEAAVSSANGKVPFSYQWNQGGMDSLITSLGPGQYTVTVTDAFGCTSTFSFNFINPAQLQVSIATVPASSLQNPNGSATAMPQGGSPAYAYAWSTGAQTQQITGLAPGAYTVTITDTHGCTAIAGTVVQWMSASQNPENMQVKVWPNPAGQELQFQGPEGASGRVLLYDLLGREALSGQVSGGRAVLDLGALPGGVYQWRWEEAGVVKATGIVERM